MSLSRLCQYLDRHSIQYALFPHPPISAAQGITVSVHVPLRELAKAVMIKADGELAMAVLPALSSIDIELLKREAHVKSVKLATEDEYHHRFLECETGAIPLSAICMGWKYSPMRNCPVTKTSYSIFVLRVNSFECRGTILKGS